MSKISFLPPTGKEVVLFDLDSVTDSQLLAMDKEIAIFMGWTVNFEQDNQNDLLWCTSNNVVQKIKSALGFSVGKGYTCISKTTAEKKQWEWLCGRTGILWYSKDWRKLMAVCDEIEKLNNGLDGIYGNGTTPLMIILEGLEDGSHKGTIVFNEHPKFEAHAIKRFDALYKLVADFCKWYNKMKKASEK